MIFPRLAFIQSRAHYSYKTARLASILLLLGVCTPTFAKAAGEYSVDNIIVDAGGYDTTAARNKALAAGQFDAFKQLITRLNPNRAAEIISKTSPSQAGMMVRGFEVVDEKMTTDHYHATMQYNFDPAQMQALIAKYPPSAPAMPVQPAQAEAAAAAETAASTPAASKAVLVLPVYDTGSGLELWQDNNKWLSTWYDTALEAGSGLVIAPLGTLDDRVDVDDTNVETASAATLSRMYGRYGVGSIYVLSAFYNLKADPKPTLEVTLKRLGEGKDEVSHMNYTIHSTETLDTLMVRASTDIAKTLYTQQTIDPNKIEYERLKDIEARINTSDIREWETLRKRLLAHSNIVSIRYTSISFYETTMIITFKGTADILGKTLVAAGLRVMQDGDSLVLSLK